MGLSSPKPRKSAKSTIANKSLKVIVVNVQSIVAKREELWELLDSSDPDVVVVTETLLKPTVLNSEIFPPCYAVFRKDRKDGYGGVLVAVKCNS